MQRRSTRQPEITPPRALSECFSNIFPGSVPGPARREQFGAHFVHRFVRDARCAAQRIQSNSADLGQHVARFGPNSTEFAKSWPRSVGFSRVAPHIGPPRSRLSWPKSRDALTRAERCTRWAPRMHRCGTCVLRQSSAVGRVQELGKHWADLGRSTSDRAAAR